jgi:hypothetical protein
MSISSDLFHILSIHNIRLCEEKLSYLYNLLQISHHMTVRSTYKICKVVIKQSDPMITVLFNPKYILNETKLLQNMQAHKDNSYKEHFSAITFSVTLSSRKTVTHTTRQAPNVTYSCHL